MRKLRSRLTYANVMATLAFFIAVAGGTAYAANTIFSSDIVNGEVKSVDIGNGEVTAADLASDSVNGGKLRADSTASRHVVNNSLKSEDVLDGSIGSADITDQSVTGDDLAGTGEGGNGFNGDQEIIDGTITGFDIGNDQIGGNLITDGSLTAGDTENVFDAGYASDGACNDDDQDGEGCASMTLELHQPGVLLVNATGQWENVGSSGDGIEMSCVLKVDGLDVGIAQDIGEAGDNHPTGQNGTMALTALSPQLEAGSHTVQTFCTEFNADIDLEDNQITAARVDL